MSDEVYIWLVAFQCILCAIHLGITIRGYIQHKKDMKMLDEEFKKFENRQ